MSTLYLQPRRFEPVGIARMFDFVREAQSQGQNRGLWVEGIQHIAGGATGDSWCVEFGWVVFTIAYAGHCPWPRMQSCEHARMFAARSGWVVTDPQRNDIVLHLDGGGRAHHFGIVTEPDPLSSIAGNTSEDGSSPNGDRVAEHAILTPRERLVFIRVPFAPP